MNITNNASPVFCCVSASVCLGADRGRNIHHADNLSGQDFVQEEKRMRNKIKQYNLLNLSINLAAKKVTLGLPHK